MTFKLFGVKCFVKKISAYKVFTSKKTMSLQTQCACTREVEVASLIPNPRNPNKHPPEQIAALAKMIEFQGWRHPIVVSQRSGFIVTGHGRLEAAKLLNLDKVPVDFQEFESEAQEWAHLIADNRIAELAEMDGQQLKDLLEELDTGDMDMGLTGYDETALEQLMNQFHQGDEQDAEPQIDKAEELNKVWKVKTGDLWLIGEHRLLCGDSTKKEDVVRVMDGNLAQIVFTDPPYGVKYSGLGQSTSQQTIENDNLDVSELGSFLLAAFKSMPCADGCNIFVCHADQKAGIRPAFESSFIGAGFHLGGTIIWVKNVASMGWQDFRAAHEPILFGWKSGGDRIRVKDRALTTVWEVGREGNYLHPTTKPRELVAVALRSSSEVGFNVYDPFLGSGTTMVAAQNLSRKCYGIEISPAYCAVILERMKTAFPNLKIRKAE